MEKEDAEIIVLLFLVWAHVASGIKGAQRYTLTISGDLSRFKHSLPLNIITDEEDGDLSKLKLEIFQQNGDPIPLDNWVVLMPDSVVLFGYFNQRVFDGKDENNQYVYILRGTDSDDNTWDVRLEFDINAPRPRLSYYSRSLELTSEISSIFTLYDAIVLSFIHDSIFAYLQQEISNIDHIRSEIYEVTRSNGATSIKLEWSTNTFAFSGCNVPQIINFRTKTVGANRQTYLDIFSATYNSASFTELFRDSCSYLSADPAAIGTALQPITVTVGTYLLFPIPDNVFSSTMSIALKLQTENGGSIASIPWLTLKGNVLSRNAEMEIVALYSLAANQLQYTFRLVAVTELLSESYQTFTISFDGYNNIEPSIIYHHFATTQPTFTSFTQFTTSFVSRLTSYLGLASTSSIIMDAYSFSDSRWHLNWTISSAIADSCALSEIRSVSSKVISTTGSILTAFKIILNDLGFDTNSAVAYLGAQCQTPVLQKQIGEVTYQWGTEFRYVIPQDAIETVSSSALTLAIVYNQNDIWKVSSWLYVDTKDRIIYGIPRGDLLTAGNTYEFTLRASIENGGSVDDKFTVKVDTNAPLPSVYNVQFDFEFIYDNNVYGSYAHVAYGYFNKVKEFMGISQITLQLNEVFSFSGSRKVVYRGAFNTSLPQSTCDFNAINQLSTLYQSAEFQSFLSPQISDFKYNKKDLGICQANNAPYLANVDYLQNGFFGPRTFVWGEVYAIQLPDDLFADEEDGKTIDLTVTLRLRDFSMALPQNSWIFFYQDTTTQTIYVVVVESAFTNLGGSSYYYYNMRAEDSRQRGVTVQYIARPGGEASRSYIITFQFQVFQIASRSYSYQLYRILQELWTFFGTSWKNRICVLEYSLTATTGENGMGQMRWVPCHMPTDRCNFQIINELRSFMFQLGTQNMREEIKQLMGGIFLVTGITETATDTCGLNPPEIDVPVPDQQYSFCGTFSYQVPANAFKDAEDGNARNLALSLTNRDGTALAESSWIQFDSQTQTIFGVALQSLDTPAFRQTQQFQLIARDRSLLTASQTINVQVTGTVSQIGYQITMRAQVSLTGSNQGKNPVFILGSKVGDFLNDEGRSFGAVSSSFTSDGRVEVTFGNCLIQYDPCDVFAVEEYKRKFKSIDNNWRSSFTNALLPEFPSAFLEDAYRGACANDRPPELVNAWGPLVVTVQLSYQLQVPAKTFFDQEQGDTPNLVLRLQTSTYQVLASNFWVQFDATTQTVSIVAYKSVAELLPGSTLSLRLIAADIKGQTAEQVLQIRVTYPTVLPSHSITMVFVVTITTIQNSFTVIFNRIRTDILRYFSNDITSNIVTYYHATTTISATLTVRWSNSTISSTECENDKITYMISRLFSQANVQNEKIVTGTIHQSFRAALSSFSIQTMQLEYDGICTYEPQVRNPVPTIPASFCNAMKYQIPENTFFDEVDGGTRQLTLTLTNADSSALASNSWVWFETESQTVIITPYGGSTTASYPALFTYNLRAWTKRGKSVTTPLTIRIDSAPPRVSFYMDVTGTWISDGDAPHITSILYQYHSLTSSFLGYATAQDIYIVDINRQTSTSTTFTLQATSCALRYDPCDRAGIAYIRSKVYDEQLETFSNTYATALRTSIRPQVLKLVEQGPCQRNNTPPRPFRQIQPFNVQTCSARSYRIPAESFIDDEDGFNLNFMIHLINGAAIDRTNSWIYSTIDNEILMTVNNDVFRNQPSGGYVLTIRAFDSQQLYADANWIVRVSGSISQTFYKITVSVTSKNPLREAFVEKYHLATAVNTFLDNRPETNIVSYEKVSTNKANFVWTYCGLPNYCNNNAANIFFRNIKLEGSINARFAQAFESDYIVDDVIMTIDPACDGPVDPPIPSRETWTISVSYCGGITEVVPANMFTDAQDGDTRQLTLSFLQKSGASINSIPWVDFDVTAQRLTASMLRSEAVGYVANPTQFTLRAKDSSGLTADITVIFNIINLPLEPKYIFKFEYAVASPYSSRALELQAFATKLSAFLGYSNNNRIGYISHAQPSTTLREVRYADCTISYNPCDKASLEALKTKFFGTSTLPTSAFSDAMRNEFIINYGNTEVLFPCNTGPSPPRAIDVIPNQIIPICGVYTYQVPENTFKDDEQGNTRQLTLTLHQTATSASVSASSWLQISTTQVIQGIVMTSLLSSMSQSFTYYLKATDNTDLSDILPVTFSVSGPYDILNECQIETIFSTSDTTSNAFSVMRYLKERMEQYFLLTSGDSIAVVNYERQSASTIKFTWSYCSASYQVSSSSYQVDYEGLVKKVLMNLFREDRRSWKAAFSSAFGSQYAVSSVTTRFTGRCRNLPPVVPPNTPAIQIQLPPCGVVKYPYQKGIFYDFEDGDAYALSLHMETISGAALFLDSWANVDTISRSVVAASDDAVRSSATTTYYFFLVATDQGGRQARLSVVFNKEANTQTQDAVFQITFIFMYNGDWSRDLAYQRVDIMERIAAHYALQVSNVKLLSFTPGNGYPLSRIISWTTCSFQSCDSSVLSTTQSLYDPATSQISSALANRFKPMYDITRVYYQAVSCVPTPSPPFPPDPVPPQDPTYCQLFQYDVSLSAFQDRYNGNARQLNVQLVDDNGGAVSSSSWIQFNQASFQLYGIAIASHYEKSQTASYRLSARNSANMVTTSLPFTAKMRNFPYTVDCPITMTFEAKNAFEKSVDIDVLWQLIQKVQEFYQDETVKVKILEFYRISSKEFYVQWSNCSFQFSSAELAKQGLTEAYRESIKNVFSKVVSTTTTQATQQFASFLQEWFTIKTISASYNCIEEPPVPSRESITVFPESCKVSREYFDKRLFTDARDGDVDDLKLAFTDLQGNPVSLTNWWQIDSTDPKNKFAYGTLTFAVKANQPSGGYRYLLVATDQSGRTASIEYIVNTANVLPTPQFQIVLGFTTTYSYQDPTAKVLAALTDKIGAYFDPNKLDNDVLVHSFAFKNTLRFSTCQTPCTSQGMNDLYTKFQSQRYSSTPRSQFAAALQPEFNANYVFIDSSKCPVTPDPPITPKRCDASLTICSGWLTIVLRQDCFIDNQGLTTKNFLVEMRTDVNEPIQRSSWIQFETSGQFAFGVAIWNQISVSMQYRFVATHPQSGRTATSIAQYTFTDYETINSILPKVCQITMSFKYIANPSYLDVYLIQSLLRKVAAYLNSNMQSILVISFKREAEELIITWTNCTWISILQNSLTTNTYMQSVNSIMSSIFTIRSGAALSVTQTFIQSMRPEFEFTGEYSVSTRCFIPPDPSPPTVLKSIEFTVPYCGAFEYPIVPTDIFEDKKYGADSLDLQLVLTNGDPLLRSTWVRLNANKVIYGLVNNLTILNEPNSGYAFGLLATNQDDQSITAKVTIKIQRNVTTGAKVPLRVLPGAVAFLVAPPGNEVFELDFHLQYVNRISQFNTFAQYDLTAGWFVTTVTFGPATEMRLYYCSQCDLGDFNTAYNQLLTQQVPLLNWMKEGGLNIEGNGRFVFDTMAKYNQWCATDSLLAEETDTFFNFTMCEYKSLDLDAIFFYSNPEVQAAMYPKFSGLDGQPLPLNSWFYVFEDTFVVKGFPKNSDWENQPAKGYAYRRDVFSTVDDSIIARYIRYLRITGTPRTTGPRYTISLQTTEGSAQPDVYYIDKTWQGIGRYFDNTHMQLVEFQRTSTNPFKFTVTWLNCSLPTDCQGTEVTQLNQFLFGSDGGIPSDAFGAGYTVDNFYSSCNRTPPVIQDYSITIPPCGIYKQIVRGDLATDSEDGNLDGQLVLELRMIDGTELPQTSWIYLDPVTREIIALPPVTISGVYRYQLMVTSTTSRQTATSILTVTVEASITLYYVMEMNFISSLPLTMPYVELQMRILNTVLAYLGLSEESLAHLRMYDFVNTQPAAYLIRWANCSVENIICPTEAQSLAQYEDNIFTPGGAPTTIFATYMQNQASITVIFIQRDSTRTYQTDTPPSAIGTVNNIVVTYCTAERQQLPSTLFVDSQNGITQTLTYVLCDQNGNLVRDTNWVYIYKTSGVDTLYVTPLTTTNSGRYQYRLKAEDKCGQQAFIDFSVILNGVPVSFGYYLTMSIQTPNTSPYAFYIWSYRSKLVECLQRRTDVFGTLSFGRTGTLLTYSWGICDINYQPCDASEISKLQAQLFTSGIINTAFKSCFEDEHVITEITQNKGNCPVTPPVPKVPELNLEVGFCEELNFQLDEDLFVDTDDGNINDLTLALFRGQSSFFLVNEWLQFDRTRNVIYGYPRTSLDPSSIPRSYRYTLVATDSDNQQASIRVNVNIIGEAPQLTYVLTLTGQTGASAFEPFVVDEIKIINKLKVFFNDPNINDVSYTKSLSPSLVTFRWSFCKLRQVPCDCYEIGKRNALIEDKNQFISFMRPEVTVQDVTSELRGNCLQNRLPEQRIDLPAMPFNVGWTYYYLIPADTFNDFEDGGTRNLTLYLADQNDRRFSRTWWLQMDDNTQAVCGALYYTEYEKLATKEQYEYQLMVRDGCGGITKRSVTSTITNDYPRPLNWILIMIINTEEGNLMTNCSCLYDMQDKIATYADVPRDDVYIREIKAYNATANMTSVHFGFREWSIDNCTNATRLKMRERFINSDDTVNQTFVSYMNGACHPVRDVSENLVGPCLVPPIVAPPQFDDFPWWILWLFLALVLLFLLLWCCWLWFPRCCPGCCTGGICGKLCGRCCDGCCGSCCAPAGNYSSFDDDVESGVLAKPIGEGDGSGAVAPIARDDGSDGGGGGVAPVARDDGSEGGGGGGGVPVDEEDFNVAPVAVDQSSLPDDDFFSGKGSSSHRDEVVEDAQVAALVHDDFQERSDDFFESDRKESHGEIVLAPVYAHRRDSVMPIRKDSRVTETTYESSRRSSANLRPLTRLPDIPKEPLQIKTESYYDSRDTAMGGMIEHEHYRELPPITVPSAVGYRASRQRQVAYIDRNDTYRQGTGRIRIIDSSSDKNQTSSYYSRLGEEQPVRFRMQSPTRSRKYRHLDALVDAPIIVQSSRHQSRSHQRRASDGNALLKQRRTNFYRVQDGHLRRRSASPVRISPLMVSPRRSSNTSRLRTKRRSTDRSLKLRVPDTSRRRRSSPVKLVVAEDDLLDASNIKLRLKDSRNAVRVGRVEYGSDYGSDSLSGSTSDSGVPEDVYSPPNRRHRSKDIITYKRRSRSRTRSPSSKRTSNVLTSTDYPIRLRSRSSENGRRGRAAERVEMRTTRTSRTRGYRNGGFERDSFV